MAALEWFAVEFDDADGAGATFARMLGRAMIRLPDGFAIAPIAPNAVELTDPGGETRRFAGEARHVEAAMEEAISSHLGSAFFFDSAVPPPSPALLDLIDEIRPQLPDGFRLDPSDEMLGGVRIVDPDGIWSIQGGSLEAIVSGIEDSVSEHTTEPFSLDVTLPAH